MTDRAVGAIWAGIAGVITIIYMGCGAILAHLIGINESALAWWAMVVAWPLVLLIFLVIGWAIFAFAYFVVMILAYAVASR